MQPTHFSRLTRGQAEAYLETFRSEHDGARHRLAALADATGGPTESQLAPTPEGLVPLWAWARHRVTYRDGYVPPPSLGAPPVTPPATWDDLDPDALPSWGRHWHPPELGRLADDTWHLVDLLAHHLVDVMLALGPGRELRVGHNRTPGYVHEGRPVVSLPEVDDETEASPISIAAGAAFRQVLGMAEDGELRRLVLANAGPDLPRS